MKKIIIFILKFFGYKYLVNMRTKEIHLLDSNYKNCYLNNIKFKRVISDRKLDEYISKGFDGCHYCLSELDN